FEFCFKHYCTFACAQRQLVGTPVLPSAAALRGVDPGAKNAYYGVPIFPLPEAARCAEISVALEEAYYFYGANARCDVEADAGLPRRKYREGANIEGPPQGGFGGLRIQIRGVHSDNRIGGCRFAGSRRRSGRAPGAARKR